MITAHPAAYHNNLGNTLAGQGQYEQAAAAYEQAITLQENFWEARNNLGNALRALGRHEEARASYAEALRCNPDGAEIFLNLGLLEIAAGNHGQALTHFQKAVTLKPDYAEAYKYLGSLLFNLGYRQEGENAAGIAVRLAPEDSGSNALLAAIILNKDEPSEAIAYYKRSLGKDSDKAAITCAVVKSALLDGNAAEKPRPYWRALTDVLIETDFWTIIDGPHHYCAEVSNMNYLNGSIVKAASDDEKTLLLEYPQEIEEINQDAILLGGHPNYYHMLFDYLPRLMALEDSELMQKLPLVTCGEAMPSFFLDSLQLLGIPAERLIRICKNKMIRCRRIIVPTMPSTRKELHPRITAWLRERLMPPHLRAVPRGSRNIYLSRAREKTKNLVNEEEILAVMKPLGFEVIFPQDHTLEEQIEIFADARCIVGPHGTALTNMLWSPESTAVVDLRSNFNSFRFLQELADGRGMRYEVISGRAEHPRYASKKEKQDANFSINPDELRALLGKIL